MTLRLLFVFALSAALFAEGICFTPGGEVYSVAQKVRTINHHIADGYTDP